MYLLTISHSLNQSFRVADTAVDQNVAATLKTLNGFEQVANHSTLNLESTNVNINIHIKLASSSKLSTTFTMIENAVIDNLKVLIGKKPSNVQIAAVTYDK